MRPHSQNVNDPSFRINLIDEAVLDIDAAGVVTGQVAYELLESG